MALKPWYGCVVAEEASVSDVFTIIDLVVVFWTLVLQYYYSTGRFPDGVCGGYIVASTKSTVPYLLFSSKICAYGCFNICIFVNIKIKNKNKIRPIWRKKLDDNQLTWPLIDTLFYIRVANS